MIYLANGVQIVEKVKWKIKRSETHILEKTSKNVFERLSGMLKPPRCLFFKFFYQNVIFLTNIKYI